MDATQMHNSKNEDQEFKLLQEDISRISEIHIKKCIRLMNITPLDIKLWRAKSKNGKEHIGINFDPHITKDQADSVYELLNQLIGKNQS